MTGREQLSRSLGAVELRAVTVDRFHLGVELGRDIYHEGRLYRILSVGLRINDFIGAVGFTLGIVVREPREIARVPAQLGGDAVVRMASGRERKDHRLGTHAPNQLDDHLAGFPGVENSRIG